MAGNLSYKFDPKQKSFGKGSFSNEIIQDSHENPSPPPSKFSLRGILGLGQTVELGQKAQKVENWGKEFFSNISHLEKEEKVLLDNRQQELQKTIEELQAEIQRLTKATENLEKEVEDIALSPIAEVSQYQVGFLDRIRQFISNFRKNISQAGIWLESFQSKKRKRNCFWNTVKDKKGGGEQYLFSNEHSVARSGT